MKKNKVRPAAAPVRRNGSTARVEARPSSEFNLTANERALLKDPDWMTEDEADLIIALRREAEGGEVPLEDVLARYGVCLED